MSEKSSASVYIGAPEEFAEWIGYSVDELLEGVDETETATNQADSEQPTSDEESSGGLLSRLLGD
jgi:hypothetical protein